MLTLEAPFFEIKDVLVFRDHAVPTLFYYLAGPPRLTVDNGKAQFTLLKYRTALDAGGSSPRLREQLGGAFLMIGVDCGLSDSTRSAIMSELASHVPDGAGEISLVPVLYTKGTAKVVALDYQSDDATAPAPPAPGGPGVIGGPMGPPPIGGPGGFGGPVVPPPIGGPAPSGNGTTQSKFVRGVVGSATPSLLQDQRAIFSLSLTPDAATLIEDAYEVDLSPIGVMYELEFSGLRPALSVHATVDRKRCYEFFKAGLHIGMGTGGGTQPAGGGTQPEVRQVAREVRR